MPIDPHTRRRTTRAGLAVLDEARACPGYVLFAPITAPGDVCLIDLQGNVAHRWQLPWAPGLWGYLLPNSNLFYLGHVPNPAWERLPFDPRRRPLSAWPAPPSRAERKCRVPRPCRIMLWSRPPLVFLCVFA
jgi:hypothetical protein